MESIFLLHCFIWCKCFILFSTYIGIKSLIKEQNVLSNQTWVCLPNAQQSQSTDPRLWWKKSQRLFQGQARRIGSSCSKDLNSLMVFKEGFLKAALGVRVVGCLISLWTFFWLVGAEVTQRYFRWQHHQPSGPNWSEV